MRRARKGRAGRVGALTHERLGAIVAVYLATGTARLQAGMPPPHAVPYTLREAHESKTLPELTNDAAGLLRCIEQLVAGAHGEPMTLADATALLVATMRAKVAEHAKRDEDAFKTGVHATIGALTVKANFGKWIAAGQAKLDRDARAAAPGSKKTSYVAPWEGQTGRPPTVEECEAALRRLKA